ncbi:succinoglycan biosynthesis protein ExoU [Pseudorhizobium tarimense]|uniref:Succinoglycan biosynthesis protein ExoU n=1 Tax=Pseudorhizobium tarimense TaxID=1079109 RepID=A0ABV2H175_9HYPH|nr:glycosyltransferase family 2 protein [Pseudorhizobium tarimense]MCJ8517475.1 glycosyltransferase [Pseudorhizobium tarimense]
MTKPFPDAICVIIAARNAAAILPAAIRSALSQPGVTEVVLVDDASTDDTAAVAESAGDGSGRLRVISLKTNRGPAAARNVAIENSAAPLIAILDADDFFFPGRFEAMLQHRDWDLIADNIAFTRTSHPQHQPQDFQARARSLSTIEFIEGNISQPGLRRGEIGFLKPVMRRSFLDEHGLRYNENLRLGEDYDLYLRALVKGARYTVIEHVGYGAVVRPDSLSGQHRTEDLRRLCEADAAVRKTPGLPEDVAAAIRRHESHIRDRYRLRAFLDSKKRGGMAEALRFALRDPAAMPAIASGIYSDKTQRLRPAQADVAPETGFRYLLPGVPLAHK